MMNYCSWTILNETKIEKRVKKMIFWIQVVENSIKIKDTQSAIIIDSSLNNASIQRLVKTKSKIPSKYFEKLQRIEQILTPASGYKNIRIFQNDCDQVSPYLGLILTSYFFFFLIFNFFFTKFT